MPKKKRKARNRRCKARPQYSRPAPPAPVALPEGAPLVLLEFSPQATAEQVERASRYWNPDADGGWVEPVSAIGSAHKLAQELRSVCEAYLLSQLCRACSAPLYAATRSDAVALAGHDLRGKSAQFLCAPCRHAQEQRQAEAARAEQEQARAAEEIRHAALSTFFDTQSNRVCRHHRRSHELTMEAVCVLAAMIERAHLTPALPALNALPTGWIWDQEIDSELVTSLFRQGWINIARSTPTDAFLFDEQGEPSSFYTAKVRWRLATTIEQTQQDLFATLLAHSKTAHLEQVRVQVLKLEAFSLFRYLDDLLSDRYQYPTVPESKLSDLYTSLYSGLEDYTFGQMICFLWRSADTAAAWKERKQLADAHASSAVPTILAGKLADARERRAAIPEYEIPRAHIDPPALPAARSLLHTLQERIAELGLCELHQHSLPCSNCLGTLYADTDSAQEIREHFTLLGEDSIVLRPDLATKPQIQTPTER